MLSFVKLDKNIQAQLAFLLYILAGLCVTLIPWLRIETEYIKIGVLPIPLKCFSSSIGILILLLGLISFYKTNYDLTKQQDIALHDAEAEITPDIKKSARNEENEEIKCLFNSSDSADQVKQMYKDIEQYLYGKNVSDLVIYDANLQTLKPSSVWNEDRRLVEIAKEHRVEWYYLAGNNSEKETFNKDWKKEVKWEELDRGNYKEIAIPDKKYPFPNLFSVPQLGQCYIGFGDYDSLGIKKDRENNNNTKGGGIWINNKEASHVIADVISALHKLS